MPSRPTNQDGACTVKKMKNLNFIKYLLVRWTYSNISLNFHSTPSMNIPENMNDSNIFVNRKDSELIGRAGPLCHYSRHQNNVSGRSGANDDKRARRKCGANSCHIGRKFCFKCI